MKLLLEQTLDVSVLGLRIRYYHVPSLSHHLARCFHSTKRRCCFHPGHEIQPKDKDSKNWKRFKYDVYFQWQIQLRLLFLQQIVFRSSYTCSCKAINFSSVSTTASFCPRASHLDLAVSQLTSSLYRVKKTVEPTSSVPAEERLVARNLMCYLKVFVHQWNPWCARFGELSLYCIK